VFRDLYRFSSILDFWARYNQPVHHFLRERVYQPLRGRLGPRGAILATFFASGLFHEYIFVSVDPRLLGIQLGFFAIQGLGGLGEQGLRRLFGVRRRAPWLARAGSWAFVYFTTIPFMWCLEVVVDLHEDLGAWLVRFAGQG